MKKYVKISTQSKLITVFVMALMIAIMILCFYVDAQFGGYFTAAMLVGLCGAALYFTPISVEANPKELTIYFTLRRRTFPLKEISDVRTWIVGSDAIRVCASGGWFGYWGWFRNRTLGKSFGYFGSHGKCFLMHLRDGRYYVIGCDDPNEMVAYIRSQLQARQ